MLTNMELLFPDFAEATIASKCEVAAPHMAVKRFRSPGL